jgi:hypothetical protein
MVRHLWSGPQWPTASGARWTVQAVDSRSCKRRWFCTDCDRSAGSSRFILRLAPTVERAFFLDGDLGKKHPNYDSSGVQNAYQEVPDIEPGQSIY